MTKIIPPLSPECSLAIARASYMRMDEANQFLRKHKSEILQEETFRGWRVVFVKTELTTLDKKVNTIFSIAVRGTDPWHNWGGNIAHDISSSTCIFTAKRMEGQILRWEQDYKGQVAQKISHSGGCEPINEILTERNLPSVFFNPHKALDKRNNWNLCTDGDLLTRYSAVKSGNPEKYMQSIMIVGEGGHTIDGDGFERGLRGTTWGQGPLAEDRAIQLDELVEAEKSINDHCDNLESGDVVLGTESSRILQDDLELKKKALKKAEETLATLQNWDSNAKMIESTVRDLIAQIERDEQRTRALKVETNGYEKQGGRYAEEMRRPSHSYALLARMTVHDFHPKTILGVVREIEELSKHYDQQVQQVVKDLKDTNHLDGALQAQFRNIRALDQRQQQDLLKLVKKQKEIGEKYRKLGTIFSVLKIAGCFLDPGLGLVTGIASSLGNATISITSHRETKRNDKRIDKARNNRETNFDAMERLVSMNQRNQADHDLHFQNATTLLSDLVSSPSQFVPETHRQALRELIDASHNEKARTDDEINRIQAEIKENDKLISTNRSKWTENQNTKKTGEKKEKRQKLEAEANVLASKYGDLTTKKLELDARLKDQEKTQDLVQAKLKLGEEALEKAARYAEFRERIWTATQARNNWWNGARGSEVREEVLDKYDQFNKGMAQERQIVQTLDADFHNLAHAVGAQRVGVGIDAMSATYQLYDHYNYCKNVAFPSAKLLLESNEGSTARMIASNLATFIGMYVHPAVSAVVAAVRLGLAVQSMWHKSPSEQEPIDQKIVKEINNSLIELDRRIARKIGDLEESLKKEYEEIGKTLRREICHISEQMEELRKEIANKLDQTNARRFVDVKRKVSRSIHKDFRELPPEGSIHSVSKMFAIVKDHLKYITSQKDYITISEFETLLEKESLELEDQEKQRVPSELGYVSSKLEDYRKDALYTTRALASELDVKTIVPNWKLLSDLTNGFIEYTNKHIEIIQEDNALKKECIQLGEHLIACCNALSSLHLEIEPLIKKIQEQKNPFLNAKRAEIIASLSQLRSTHTAKQKQAIDGFKWNTILDHPVGDKRFALNRSFVSYFKKISQLSLEIKRRLTIPHKIKKTVLLKSDCDIQFLQKCGVTECTQVGNIDISFCTPVDINKLQRISINPDNYNKTLKQLVLNYRSVLYNKILEKSLVEITNKSLAAALTEGEVVLSLKADGIPLLFPKKLLRHLSLLNPALLYYQALGRGISVPYYEFSSQTRELNIHYKIISPGSKQFEFAKYKIASFDSLTIDSFRHDATSNAEFDPSEFLIQAMYGTFADSALGLPDENSVSFSDSKQIALSEQPFTGLFKLWDKFPNQTITYDSKFVSKDISPDKKLDNKFLSGPIFSQPSKDFEEVATSIREPKKGLVAAEKQYKKSFDNLMMLVTLYTNLDRNVVLQRLERDLEIFSPENLMLYEMSSTKQVWDNKIELFIEFLSKCPNKYVTALAELRMELYKTTDSINLPVVNKI